MPIAIAADRFTVAVTSIFTPVATPFGFLRSLI
jgi:hypothetical protein